MRAVALSAEGQLEVVDKPEPVPGPADVVVAVERCGICGSDLHLRDSGFLPAGAVMGHEFAGKVVLRGEGVPDEPAEGQRVAVLPAARCGTCEQCRAGRSHLCASQLVTAIGLGVNDGAFAEYVRAPAASCHVLPEAMSPEQGALVEPYAVGLHAVARSRVPLWSNAGWAVGILGAGPIGLMCVAALRRAGASNIVVAEPDESRAEAARAMGATPVEKAARMERAIGQELEVVFDAAGTPDSLVLALESVKPGGQVVLVGAPGPGQMTAVPGLLWLMKEVDVAPAMAYTNGEFEEAVRAIAAGAVEPHLVVSEVRPLEDAERSFQELKGPRRPLKVMLAPGDQR